MRSSKILATGFLALVVAACNLAKSPLIATVTPDFGFSTPTPLFTSTELPLPTLPDLPLKSSLTLVHITFLDSNIGWGIDSSGTGAILCTVDGGSTWYDATPPGLTGIGYTTGLSVLDSNVVWVQVPNPDFFTGMLYHTTDGGTNWTSVAVPFGSAILQFLDASSGVALAGLGVGLGSEAVEIFQTSNGGLTWMSVFNNDPDRPDASGSLPFGGIKNGMTFLDADHGWVTGTRPMNGDIYLFNTNDGGIDWSLQSIPLPAGYESFMYMPQTPVFFGQDGFLPLIIYLSDATLRTFYYTHDGGITWTGDPLDPARMISPGQYAFADSLHGWSWDGGENLFSTLDGAQTWSMKPVSLDLDGRLAQLVFVRGTAGEFTGWALTVVDDSGHSLLYKTADNGSTWTLLIH